MPLIENARLLFTSLIPMYPGMRSLSAPQSKGGWLPWEDEVNFFKRRKSLLNWRY